MEPHWREPLEEIVKKKAEHCNALYVAHQAAYRWAKTWDTRFQLTSIFLSLFSGAGAVGSATILPFDGSATLVGVISLLVGCLQSVQNRLEFAKRAESHRISSLAYQKLYVHLDLQLSLPRKEREEANTVIENMKKEFDRLSEIEPPMPEHSKAEFHKRFGDLKDYHLPSILNGLEPVVIAKEEGVGYTPTPPVPVIRPVVRVEV
jgi:hypothetical protein